MHYYKRNIGDYAKKAGRLSMLQHGAYTLLLDTCYDREQFPTKEEAIEWTWASTTAEIEAVEFVLRKFFTLEDGVYVQKRVKEELEEYHSKAKTNKRIAQERETKRKEKRTKRVPDVHEPPPNHKPLTKNHNKTHIEVSSIVKNPTGETPEHDTPPETIPEVRVPPPQPRSPTVSPETLKRKGALFQKLRDMSIDAAPHMLAWQEILPNFTDEEILGAAATARDKRPQHERIHINYILAILRDRAPPPAVGSDTTTSTRRGNGNETSGRDNRTRAQRVSDTLDEIARESLEAERARSALGSGDLQEVPG